MEQKEKIKKAEYFRNRFKNIMKDQNDFDPNEAIQLMKELQDFEDEHSKISEIEGIKDLDISWLNDES